MECVSFFDCVECKRRGNVELEERAARIFSYAESVHGSFGLSLGDCAQSKIFECRAAKEGVLICRCAGGEIPEQILAVPNDQKQKLLQQL